MKPEKITPPFDWRVDECSECQGSGRVRGTFGGGPYPCDDCGGLGWTGRLCVSCGDEARLNSDDECEQCSTLTHVTGDPLLRRAM